MLEITHTVEARKMRDQVLDSMELERERGITIKMQPVRMEYISHLTPNPSPYKGEGEKFILNLIDTPGHVDFSYEVSRALKAVEGSILLVDSTQGVQAQTLTVLSMAKASREPDGGSFKIIPVVTKIDSPLARVADVRDEVVKMLGCGEGEVLQVSGRTGEGVELLLEEIIKRVPPPKQTYEGENKLRALVFDFKYSNHRGVIVFIRVLDGKAQKGDNLLFAVSGEKFIALEVGTFSPQETPREALASGEIGYIVTGIKKPGIASVGDTITKLANPSRRTPATNNPADGLGKRFSGRRGRFYRTQLALGKLRLSIHLFLRRRIFRFARQGFPLRIFRHATP